MTAKSFFTFFLLSTTLSCALSNNVLSQTQYPAQVQDLSLDKYFPALKTALAGAKASIDVVMYLANFDPSDKNSKTTQLAQELVNAAKRGVKVRVVLDQNVDFAAHDETGGSFKKEDKNDALFVYLKTQGVEAFYDNIYSVTHSKAIVIDGETVVLGSANWTESSFTKNNEASCLIRSPGLAKEMLADFDRINIDQQASILDKDRKPPVRVSNVFLSNPSLAPRMISTNDLTAFDLYLLLLRKYDGNPNGQVDVDYPELIKIFGLDKRLSYENACDQLAKALLRLERNYKLIRRALRWQKGPSCYLLDYAAKGCYQPPEENYCALPDEYWQYGYNNSLSFPEKYCLLISYAKGKAKRGNRWTSHRQELITEFNIGRESLIRGMKGLRALNIIDIEYPDYPESGGYAKRDDTRFTLLGLYSPERLADQKANLAKVYGQDLFLKAQNYAQIVFKTNEIQVIEDIIKKIEEYGFAAVAQAFALVAKKSPDNPKRSYKYVVGILQGNYEKY